MNPQIPLEARQTVLDFVTAGTSFTAYEVTLEVRRRLGPSIDVPHGEVNAIVQTMFAGGQIIGYDRQPDPQIQAATKPFRYYQKGGASGAPFRAPVAPAISRSNLPAALRFIVPFTAMLRNCGLAARDFQRAAGHGDEPFAVWLPTLKEPTFRLRCYGPGWDETAIARRFALDLTNPGNADLLWLSPLAYADEFRLYSNVGGTQFQFLVRLDVAMQTTATKETERATGEPDGVQIEVAVRTQNIDQADRALQIHRHMSVPPRIYRDGKTLQIAASKIISEGANWKLTASTEPAAIVDEVAYSLFGLDAVAGTGVELYLDADEVDVEPSREKLVQTERTRAARGAAIAQFKREVAAPLQARIEAAANLWDAKILYRELFAPAANNNALMRLLGGAISWRGIKVENAHFFWSGNGVEIRQYLPATRAGATVSSSKTGVINAHPDRQIFINDLGKNATSRLAELQRTVPFEAAYVLSFDDDNARANFYRTLHFDSVPTRLLSQLPKPARSQTPRSLSKRTPFDANLHLPKAPTNPLVAAFANGDGGSEADFERLKKWARETPLDGQNWPDWKRLYKAIEAQLWPPQGRLRWDKSENDFAATPLPTQRQLEILGVLMGRLDADSPGQIASQQPAPSLAQRALGAVGSLLGRSQTANFSGPSVETLAYLKRRAARLLTFLRDRDDLSDERRAALAPLVRGLLQREKCLDIEATLPLQLKLDRSSILAEHPEAIERVWAGTSMLETLPLTILKWAYQWLDDHEISPRVSVTHLRRFAQFPDVEWTLRLAPAVLESDESWPANWNLTHFSRVLQGNLSMGGSSAWSNQKFLERRNDVLSLLARYPQLAVHRDWLRASLGQVSDEVALNWLSSWLEIWARDNELALIEAMSPALQSRFNAAIVAALPGGLSLLQWRQLVASPARAQLLAPALRQLPLSEEAAAYLWALPEAERAPMFAALGDNPAIAPLIRGHAQALDWAFAFPLSQLQWELFARTVAQTHAAGLGAAAWEQIADLPFENGFQLLPLGAGFWEFFLPQTSENRLIWLERVGRVRASLSFAGQSAASFERLLETDAAGLEIIGDTWLDANQGNLSLDGELIIQLAQSALSDWSARALRILARAPLALPVALRLMESGLPQLEDAARGFWEDESENWDERILALADSPNRAARDWALELLERFPDRWTPELLRFLAEHDDKGVRAWVAERLQVAPAPIQKSDAVAAFDAAILNARGQARSAKTRVQERLSGGDFGEVEALLEAARNGAPRDRAWALQQLVRASLSGVSVEGLEVEGAVARARKFER